MAPLTELRTAAPFLAGPRRGAAVAFVAAGAGVAMALAALPFASTLPAALGLALYALVGALMIERIGRHHPHGGFGTGNGITLFRAGGASVFAALALEPELLVGAGAWGALAAAAGLLALDGLDGLAARGEGRASAFGARFDLEVDALLILALAALAAGLGKAGPWVLGLGLMRYLFVLAGLALPALAAPLPASRRRRAVCALQVAVLAGLLAPPVMPPLSAILAAAAFAALAASFAIDVAWLMRPRR